MADNHLSKIDSYQYPSAHLGHLTDVQQKALDNFKELCQKQGYYSPAIASSSKPAASHDDETLLRYLRARKFNPQEAFKQFKDTEDWRKENHLIELYETIEVKEYDETRRLYPQWTGRRDRRGIPVYVFQVAHLTSKAMSAYEKSVAKAPTVPHNTDKLPTKMLRLFALYENLTRFVLPLCSAIQDRPHPETPVSQSSNIVDISGVGLKQFWNLKGHMQDASTLATAHYPETLDRIFIIGAPSFFPTVWSWVKRWFDPITVSKIFILSSEDMKGVLEKYIDVENIPKVYGGKLDYEFGMMPVLETSIVNTLNWTDPKHDLQNGSQSLPLGPIKWRQANSGLMEAVAVGSEGGKQRERTIATVDIAFQDMHGISRQNTQIDWTAEPVKATSGTDTQPNLEDSSFVGANPSSPDAAASQLKANTSSILPTGPMLVQNTIPPSESQPRKEIPNTHQEQQSAMNSAGALAEGTPHAIGYGQGNKAIATEPGTTGQAPKDISANLARVETPTAQGLVVEAHGVATSIYDTATSVASGVADTVSTSLGTAKTTSDEGVESVAEKTGNLKLQDQAIDRLEEKHIEGFLRSQYPSKDTNE